MLFGMRLISLERLSSISIAIKIWETPYIQNLVLGLYRHRKVIISKQLYNREPSQYRDLWNDDDYQLIITSAVNLLNTLELSLQLKNDCGSAIREIGEKSYNWMNHVIYVLDFNIKFASRIHWKSDGTIDDDKIFKSWETDEEFAKQEHLRVEALYILACVSANEDFIMENQFEMEKVLRKKIPDFKLNNYENKVYALLSYFLYHDYQYKLQVKMGGIQSASRAIREIMSNNPSQIISPLDMLRMCVNSCFEKAFYYIWNFISPKNEEFLRTLTLSCLHVKNIYQKDRSTELLIFLINQMSEEMKVEFFKVHAYDLFIHIAPQFPDHEIIFQLLNDYFSNFSNFECQRIILTVLEELKNQKYKVNQFRKLFYKVFTSIPSDLKEDTDQIILFLHNISDVDCFKIVLNSMGENFRIEAIREIQPHIIHIIKIRKLGLLKGFMNEMLKTDEERKSCKEFILNFIDEITIKAYSFREIDELLDFLSETPEEKSRLKNKINPLKVCEELIKKWKYDKAEKFLEWMFDSKEDLENFRKSLHPQFFILGKSFLTKVISNFLEDYKGNKNDFLKFFFGFPEERESVKHKKIYYDFREKLEMTPIKKCWRFRNSGQESKLVVKLFEESQVFPCNELYNLSEIANLFMNWICKDEKRKKNIKEMYNNDEQERKFFIKLVIMSFSPYNQSLANKLLGDISRFQIIETI